MGSSRASRSGRGSFNDRCPGRRSLDMRRVTRVFSRSFLAHSTTDAQGAGRSVCAEPCAFRLARSSLAQRPRTRCLAVETARSEGRQAALSRQRRSVDTRGSAPPHLSHTPHTRAAANSRTRMWLRHSPRPTQRRQPHNNEEEHTPPTAACRRLWNQVTP